MHDNDAIGCGDLGAVSGDLRRERSAFGDLVGGQDRIEAFSVEVVEEDGVPVAQKRLPGGLGDGVIETAGTGMGQNERELHAASDPCRFRRSISANARARSGASPT